jgi:hypothetical protein
MIPRKTPNRAPKMPLGTRAAKIIRGIRKESTSNSTYLLKRRSRRGSKRENSLKDFSESTQTIVTGLLLPLTESPSM